MTLLVYRELKEYVACPERRADLLVRYHWPLRFGTLDEVRDLARSHGWDIIYC